MSQHLLTCFAVDTKVLCEYSLQFCKMDTSRLANEKRREGRSRTLAMPEAVAQTPKFAVLVNCHFRTQVALQEDDCTHQRFAVIVQPSHQDRGRLAGGLTLPRTVR